MKTRIRDTVLVSLLLVLACGGGERPVVAQGVVFFDVLNQAAYRIGSDGELLWSWGTKGEGPGELANVQALDVAPDGSVVLVDSGNNGWMKFRGAELRGVFPYVEHVDFPEVREVRSGPLGGRSSHMMRRPVRAGVSLSVVADTLFVLFSGKTPGRGRLLDKFDVQSGEYLETEVLPHFANEAVVDGDRVFTIEAWDVFPRIVALARRAPSAP